MTKHNLNTTWKRCIEMWKWITTGKKYNEYGIYHLKREFIRIHYPEDQGIGSCCYFCEYSLLEGYDDCSSCPGKLVSPRFSCMSKTYSHSEHPEAFYRKLLKLDEKRRNGHAM